LLGGVEGKSRKVVLDKAFGARKFRTLENGY